MTKSKSRTLFVFVPSIDSPSCLGGTLWSLTLQCVRICRNLVSVLQRNDWIDCSVVSLSLWPPEALSPTIHILTRGSLLHLYHSPPEAALGSLTSESLTSYLWLQPRVVHTDMFWHWYLRDFVIFQLRSHVESSTENVCHFSLYRPQPFVSELRWTTS